MYVMWMILDLNVTNQEPVYTQPYVSSVRMLAHAELIALPLCQLPHADSDTVLHCRTCVPDMSGWLCQ